MSTLKTIQYDSYHKQICFVDSFSLQLEPEPVLAFWLICFSIDSDCKSDLQHKYFTLYIFRPKDFPSYYTDVCVFLQNRMDVSQIPAWMEVYAEATGGTTCVCVKRVTLETAARHVC